MSQTETDDGLNAVALREERLAALAAALTRTNLPLAPAMSEAEFHAMVWRMAEQQLLYEEFGSEA
jgi:hypothetical protein